MSDLPDGGVPDVILLGASFSDDYQVVTFYYIESRNVAPLAHKKEELSLDRSLLPRDEFDEVIDTLQEWLDKGLIHIRREGGKSE